MLRLGVGVDICCFLRDALLAFSTRPFWLLLWGLLLRCFCGLELYTHHGVLSIQYWCMYPTNVAIPLVCNDIKPSAHRQL